MKIQNRQKVSLKFIAQKAGVSLMTASRALNGTGHIARATEERIQIIAEKYKYRPNLLIRGVQTGRTMNIGVIFPADLGFYTNVLEGLHDELLASNYSIQLSLIHQHLGEHAIRQEHQQILRLLDLRVDGIILRPVNDDASDLYFKEVFERNIPLVTIDRKLENVHCDALGTNDFKAGQQAAEYLITKGHRNILLAATGDIVSTGRERRNGFLSSAEKVKGVHVSIINETDFKHHENEARNALTSHPEITAAFCVTDILAAGLYNTALKLGIRIPKDLSVLGFGNLGMGPYLNPPLSTFDQHPAKIGKAAAQLLVKRINSTSEKKRAQQKTISADILERQSVRNINSHETPR